MILNPSSAKLVGDGKTQVNYVFRGSDRAVNDKDFWDTIKSFAAAALNTSPRRAVEASGFVTGGFFIVYRAYDQASAGAQIKTQALAVSNSLEALKTNFLRPAAEFVAAVAGDVKDKVLGFGKIAPFLLGAYFLLPPLIAAFRSRRKEKA